MSACGAGAFKKKEAQAHGDCCYKRKELKYKIVVEVWSERKNKRKKLCFMTGAS